MNGPTMRAALTDSGSGGRVRVSEVPVPVPGPGEALVRVHAAGMNRADLLHAQGNYTQRAFAQADRPNVAGMEMAGRVVVSPNAASTGTAVMGMCAGAYADYVAVDQRLLLPAPKTLTWHDCAALPMALLTEYLALNRLANVRRDSRILITGASSSVGLLGVQLARTHDPELLVATTRSRQSRDLLIALGADEVAHDADGVAELAGPDGYDIIIDHVGGETLRSALEQLRDGARIVSVGRLSGRTVDIDLTALAASRARIIGTTWKTQELDEIAATVDGVRRELLPAVFDGDVQPVLGGSFTLESIADAYAGLEQRRTPGKQVIHIT